MEQQPDKPPVNRSLPSVEGDLLGALLDFHRKIMALLRGAPLNDENMKLVSEQVMALLGQAITELQGSNDMDVQGRLESVYEQAKRLVDDISKPQS